VREARLNNEYKELQRSSRLAKIHTIGGNDLCADQYIPARRDLRPNKPNTQSSSIDSFKYRRRPSKTEHSRIQTISLISLGSRAAVETQLIIAQKLKYVTAEQLEEALTLSDEIKRMTYVLSSKLKEYFPLYTSHSI
jgi:hypothetical protein